MYPTNGTEIKKLAFFCYNVYMYKYRLLVAFLFTIVFFTITPVTFAKNAYPWWEIQSVDTMKFSRDISRQVLEDPKAFEKSIDTQVKNIADLGATHIGIATPYDDEFLPVMNLWVYTARKYGLSIWFRGNFSGWEKWFGYEQITREEHLEKTRSFIIKHPGLFEDGDFFSPCPECENGGPGDPRFTQDVRGHRNFLIAEHTVAKQSFKEIGKRVDTSLNSMNGDVARLIMDPDTTRELGGIVTIDHYVKTPEQLIRDTREIAQSSQGLIFFGELGVPIPDIHGTMSQKEQADWIADVFFRLALEEKVIGINYWVNMDSSTALWDEFGKPKEAVAVVRSYFKPRVIEGTVVSNDKKPLVDATIKGQYRLTHTDQKGKFALPILPADKEISVFAQDHRSKKITLAKGDSYSVTLLSSQSGLLHQFFDKIRDLVPDWIWQ